ncbi:FkbM family methyltransferase [Sphingomonas sp. ST-64]|uniref:FkbM family methyltransferase n=1 Tax=Sphingomonas plantiphila TaxID=3163295 RepID=A0ABW8YJH4_9SPHN
MASNTGAATTEPRAATLLEQSGQYFDIWNLLKPPRHLNEAAVRALCRNAFLGGDWSVCRVLGRYRMFVDTQDVGLSTFLLLDGYWEMWTTEAMLRFIRPGMTAVDIGANLGYFSLLMGDLVGPTGRVVAFEPNPRMAARARQSAHVNGFAGITQIHEVALSDHGGETVMFVPPTEPKNAHFSQATGRDGEMRVRVQRADAFDAILDADFIKIDTEGAEEAVWRGMEGILRRNRPLTIFLEFTPARYPDPAAFLDTILASGFALNRIDYFDATTVPAVSRADVLDAPPHEDQMLVLVR